MASDAREVPVGAGPAGGPAELDARAVDAGLASLRYRDLSEQEVDRKLAERGFSEGDREDAVATLRRTGLLDDRRFAENRARTLAARGAGDALVRHELERAGVSGDLVADALESLEPEAERARGIVERRGSDAKTARYLTAKGFSPETIAEAVASGPDNELG